MRPEAPHTPEIERSFLGGLILHPESMHEFPVTEHWFYDQLHQRVFKAVQNLSISELPINFQTLSIFLNGDSGSVAQILSNGALKSSLPAYADLLQRQARQRQIIDRSTLASQCAARGEYDDAEAILAELYDSRPGHASEELVPTRVQDAPGVKPTLFSHGPKRGGFGLIIAGDGVGKGWVILDLLLSCSLGKPVNIKTVSHYGAPLRTLYFCYEDDSEELKSRLNAICSHAGLSPDTWQDLESAGALNFFCLPPELATQSRHDLPMPTKTFAALEDRIVRDKINLLIIDPLAAAAGLQDEDNAGMNHFAKLIRSMAARTDCTTILVHHTGKATRGNLDHQASRGGSSLPGAARWVLNIAPDSDADDDSRLIMAVTKNSYGRRVFDIRLARGEDGVIRELSGEEIASQLVTLELKLVQWLRDHPDERVTMGGIQLSRGDSAKLLLSAFSDHKPAQVAKAMQQALDAGTVELREGKTATRKPITYLCPVKQSAYRPPDNMPEFEIPEDSQDTYNQDTIPF